MSLHTNQQEQQNLLVVVDNNHDSEGDAVMSESKDNQHDQLHEKNNLINDQSLDDVANSINNNNNNLIITIPDDDNNSSKTNNVNLLLNSEGIDQEEEDNNLIISEGNNKNDIMIFDDWSKEEHIQFLQAFKRYGTDWEKVMQCLPLRNDLEHVKLHGMKYLKNSKLGPAYYEYLESQKEAKESSMSDSDSDSEEEEDTEEVIVKTSPYLTTPESLASAFLTNRESVREWNLETRRFETNVEKLKNNEPIDNSPASTSNIHADKLSLIQSNYGELLEILDIEKQTQMMDEEVLLMRQDYKMKKLTPFERVVAVESREKIEKLIGMKIQDQELPIIEPPSTISETNPQSTNDIETNGALPSAAAINTTSSTNSASTVGVNNLTNNATPPPNPELLTNEPNYRNIYAFLGALFEPTRYDVEQLGAILSPQEKEILQILLHNLSITLSTQQFQEEYSTYVQQISSSQTLRQQQQTTTSSTVNPSLNTASSSSTNTAVGASTTGGIENPFAGQSQISMLQLLSSEDPQQPPPFLNTNNINNINFF